MLYHSDLNEIIIREKKKREFSIEKREFNVYTYEVRRDFYVISEKRGNK